MKKKEIEQRLHAIYAMLNMQLSINEMNYLNMKSLYEKQQRTDGMIAEIYKELDEMESPTGLGLSGYFGGNKRFEI